MTWTRLSDDHMDREDMMQLSRDARLLHIEGLVWSNRAGTDGRIPKAALRKVTDLDDPDPCIRELVRAKLWTLTDVGWEVEWTHQEVHADVEVRQVRSRERQRRHRLHLNGEHSLCNPKYCKNAPQDASVTRDETRDETPTPPRPPRPGPKEPGRGRVRRPRLCDNGRPIAADGACCDDCGSGVRVVEEAS